MGKNFNWNFPLVGDNYKHEMATFTSASQNPILMTRIYDPLKYGSSEFEKADKVWDWVKSNIQLPTDLLDEMEAERDKIKAETIEAGR